MRALIRSEGAAAVVPLAKWLATSSRDSTCVLHPVPGGVSRMADGASFFGRATQVVSRSEEEANWLGVVAIH